MVLAFQFQITLIFFHFADFFFFFFLPLCIYGCLCGFFVVLLLAQFSIGSVMAQCKHQRFLLNSFDFFDLLCFSFCFAPPLVIENTNYLFDSYSNEKCLYGCPIGYPLECIKYVFIGKEALYLSVCKRFRNTFRFLFDFFPRILHHLAALALKSCASNRRRIKIDSFGI